MRRRRPRKLESAPLGRAPVGQTLLAGLALVGGALALGCADAQTRRDAIRAFAAHGNLVGGEREARLQILLGVLTEQPPAPNDALRLLDAPDAEAPSFLATKPTNHDRAAAAQAIGEILAPDFRLKKRVGKRGPPPSDTMPNPGTLDAEAVETLFRVLGKGRSASEPSDLLRRECVVALSRFGLAEYFRVMQGLIYDQERFDSSLEVRRAFIQGFRHAAPEDWDSAMYLVLARDVAQQRDEEQSLRLRLVLEFQRITGRPDLTDADGPRWMAIVHQMRDATPNEAATPNAPQTRANTPLANTPRDAGP